MAAKDFDLPAELETLLQQVCTERAVPRRRHDELRNLLREPQTNWPACCKGQCDPCVDDQVRIACEVLRRTGRDPDLPR